MNIDQKVIEIDKYRLALSEIDAIIKASDIEEQEKIPIQFREFVKQYKSKSYIFNVNPNKELAQQNIMRETKILLSLIYRDYLCTEDEKKELYKKDIQEKARMEDELREKYNPDSIFKNKTVINNEQVSNNMSLVEYRIPWYRKILNKIKEIFNS